MSIAIDTADRLAIKSLIRQISENYGGDDQVWLDEYAKDILETNKDNLAAAVECFTEILRLSEATLD